MTLATTLGQLWSANEIFSILKYVSFIMYITMEVHLLISYKLVLKVGTYDGCRAYKSKIFNTLHSIRLTNLPRSPQLSIKVHCFWNLKPMKLQ